MSLRHATGGQNLNAFNAEGRSCAEDAEERVFKAPFYAVCSPRPPRSRILRVEFPVLPLSHPHHASLCI